VPISVEHIRHAERVSESGPPSRNPLRRWLRSSPWHTFWVAVAFAVFGAAMVVWPDAFARSGEPATRPRIVGSLVVAFFGGGAVLILIRQRGSH
jgi:hypothetical protein